MVADTDKDEAALVLLLLLSPTAPPATPAVLVLFVRDKEAVAVAAVAAVAADEAADVVKSVVAEEAGGGSAGLWAEEEVRRSEWGQNKGNQKLYKKTEDMFCKVTKNIYSYIVCVKEGCCCFSFSIAHAALTSL